MAATVLIVDDYQPGRELAKALLRHAGHAVLEASNGDEALRIVKETAPSLVISDVVMPYVDGFELAYELASNLHLPYIPFVLYSAVYLPSEARALSSACGVDHFLPKPSLATLMLRTCKEALSGRQRVLPLAASREQFLTLHARLTANKMVEMTTHLCHDDVPSGKVSVPPKPADIGVPESVPAQRGPARRGDPVNRPLTLREQEVLQYLATGLNNSEIAAILFVSRGTIKTHVENINAKLGVTDRFKAAAWAMRNGHVAPEKPR